MIKKKKETENENVAERKVRRLVGGIKVWN